MSTNAVLSTGSTTIHSSSVEKSSSNHSKINDETKHLQSDLSPRSRIILHSNKGKPYRFTFRVENPEFEYLCPRSHNLVGSELDKAVQPRTADQLVEIRDTRYKKYMIRVKHHRALPEETTSASSRKKHTLKDIDEPCRNKIYVAKDGLLFLLVTDSLNLQISQPISSSAGDTLQSTPTERSQSVESNYENWACLVTDIAGELIRIRITLVQCNISPLNQHVSRGIQCEDKFAYHKFQPVYHTHAIYCPVPLSTYMYKDPMVEIRKRNAALKKAGRDPDWLLETRRKRREDTLRLREHSMYIDRKAFKSAITLQMHGHRLRLHGGCMKASIIKGIEKYDNFVRQNIKLRRKKVNAWHTSAVNEVKDIYCNYQ